MSRLRTLSKHYYNDEIIGIMDNGDIILHMGVKRKSYTLADSDISSMEQINYHALVHDKWNTKIKSYNDVDDNGSEPDNWE